MRPAAPLAILLAAGAGLSACGPEPPPAPAVAAEAPAPQQGPPPPEPPPPAYVGLWAAKADLCPQGAWVFDRDRVVTAGEVACEFRDVAETDTGFQVTAACAVDGVTRPYRFSLLLADPSPPRSMTVSRGPWLGPITLIPCAG
ncbi:MAG: hypothetical protein PHG43_07970 [Phenylobacterium sp.]|nr:hypothetical protein [Phenylobacterium sp.]